MEPVVYHVVPHGEEWAVKKEGADQASRVASTQADAIVLAERFASNQAPGRVVIHGENGTIEAQHTFDRGSALVEAKSWTRAVGQPAVWTGVALAIGVGALAWLALRNDGLSRVQELRRRRG